MTRPLLLHRLLRLLPVALLFSTTTATSASPGMPIEPTRLLQQPTISAEHVAFVYAGDIWYAELEGSGIARRLTTFDGSESNPHFSPDGNWVAFTGEYDGNLDVYVVSLSGAAPQRLTWHPYPDMVRGWTPDGERIVFDSGREGTPIPLGKFWTVGLTPRLPEALPVPRIAEGQISPDGKVIAYQKIRQWESEWRNYRGGQTTRSGSSISKLSKRRSFPGKVPKISNPYGSGRGFLSLRP